MERFLVVGVCSFLLLTGCATNRFADFTVVSTKNVDITRLTPEAIEAGVKVEGQHLTVWSAPNMETAIDNALEKGKGNLLLDAVVSFKSGWKSGYIVEGTAVAVPKQP
jgi:hypothetical protein